MSKPINRKQLRRRYFLFGLFVLVLIVLFFLHFGYLSEFSEPSPTLLVDTLVHMREHPFEIFPVRSKSLLSGIFAGMLAPLVTDLEYMKRRDLRPSIENGSAKWNDNLSEYQKMYTDLPLLGTGSPNIILTDTIFLSMNTRKTLRNNNVMVIGGSGTGKSRGFIIPNVLQLNCCYVITDPSGELLRSMGDFLRENDYEVRVFNLVDMENSGHYNPFSYLKEDKDVLTLMTALISNTTPKGSKSNDPFWEKAETALIQACCFYLLGVDKKENTQKASFAGVMELLRLASSEEGVAPPLDDLFTVYEEKHGKDMAVTSYAIFKSAGGGKTAQTIVICAQTRLQVFNLQAIQKLTGEDTLRLDEIGDKKVALFCVTPTEDKTFNFLVGLLYTQLFNTLYRKGEFSTEGRLKVHTRFLLDEFANIGRIPDFAEKLSTMRKYEISCSIVIQALSQIKAMYKDEWEVLISNCDSLLYLGTNDETTNKYISAALGKETIRAMNTSISKGRQGSSSQSYNKVGRELMTPDELKKLDNKDCILFIRGLDPFYSKKFVLKHHPNYIHTPLAKGTPISKKRNFRARKRKLPKEEPRNDEI